MPLMHGAPYMAAPACRPLPCANRASSKRSPTKESLVQSFDNNFDHDAPVDAVAGRIAVGPSGEPSAQLPPRFHLMTCV